LRQKKWTKIKKTKRTRKPSKKRSQQRLDNAVRNYIKARDNWTCCICGITRDSIRSGHIEWSHKIGRSTLSLRWDERNSVCHCSKCHRDWHNSKNTTETHQWIDNEWGPGTSEQLEIYSKRQSTIKGTELDDIDYRLTLEKFYKDKYTALKEGRMTREDAKSITWDDFFQDWRANVQI
jgi:5-methylcytosine-specific restriction endonuclease McrA